MLADHLEKLRGFHQTALHGSIQGGARALGISQPSLTKSLQVLESALGTRLFTRHRRGVELTPAGEVLLRYCEKLHSELPDVEKRLENPAEVSGQIRVGSYETLGLAFWPEALRALRTDYPKLSILISTQATDRLSEKLQLGIIDLIVDAEPVQREQFYSKVLYTDRFSLFTKPGVKFNDRLPVSFVQRVTDRDGVNIATHLNERGLDFELNYDFDTFVSVRAVVAAGLAVGILPLTLAREAVLRKEIAPFKLPRGEVFFGEHRICVTCLESRRSDSRLKAVMQTLRASVT